MYEYLKNLNESAWYKGEIRGINYIPLELINETNSIWTTISLDEFLSYRFLRKMHRYLKNLNESSWYKGEINYIPLELIDETNSIWTTISLDEFLSLGKFCFYIQGINPTGVNSIFYREEKTIDISNIIQVESFLFKSRRIFNNDPILKKYLEHAIKVAIKDSSDSLIETLIIILEENIINYDELFSLAKSKMHSNKKIHKALYNFLRETVPEVRGYAGEENTAPQWPWYVNQYFRF